MTGQTVNKKTVPADESWKAVGKEHNSIVKENSSCWTRGSDVLREDHEAREDGEGRDRYEVPFMYDGPQTTHLCRRCWQTEGGLVNDTTLTRCKELQRESCFKSAFKMDMDKEKMRCICST